MTILYRADKKFIEELKRWNPESGETLKIERVGEAEVQALRLFLPGLLGVKPERLVGSHDGRTLVVVWSRGEQW